MPSPWATRLYREHHKEDTVDIEQQIAALQHEGWIVNPEAPQPPTTDIEEQD